MVTISKMQPSDIDAVYALEQKCFAVPKDLAVFLADQSKYFVAKENNKIIGYIGFEEIAGEGHVINIAVAPEYRGKGIGNALVSYVLDTISKEEVKVFYLEVRASNLPAQKLYERFGFKVVGRRKGYYQENAEDALLMKLQR
ncbi:MAG: ribosomal protein S18-alanine N-acetyltransferase [Candidatus Saganbacteria bacterium]|nr:ribosomal protein S18-alanine N-acetyltransferase [Candidatus Saganbacteria bacterium]